MRFFEHDKAALVAAGFEVVEPKSSRRKREQYARAHCRFEGYRATVVHRSGSVVEMRPCPFLQVHVRRTSQSAYRVQVNPRIFDSAKSFPSIEEAIAFADDARVSFLGRLLMGQTEFLAP